MRAMALAQEEKDRKGEEEKEEDEEEEEDFLTFTLQIKTIQEIRGCMVGTRDCRRSQT